MNLPEACELVYIVPQEAWYRRSLDADKPSIVIARNRDGGCAWEFSVEEYDLNGPALQLRMFDDSRDAFEDIPEFFAALRTERPASLTQLRELLIALGAKDATERTSPFRKVEL